MARRDDAPLSGFFRVIYALTTAGVAFMVILTAITAFYDPPDDEASDFGFGFQAGVSDDSRDDYNRNVSLIFAATSAGLFGTAILGLGSRFNPIRSALLLGGGLAYGTSIGFWAASSDQWLGFLLTLTNFVVMGVGFVYLEDGLPLEATTVRRLEIPPSGFGERHTAPPAAPPPPPPPQFAPPPRTMPPDEPETPQHETEPPPMDDQPPEPVN